MMTMPLRDVRSVPTGLRIDVVDSAVAFAALRDEWTELLASSRSDTLFLTWEWLHTWWIHFGQGKRLFIVTVRSQSQLVAIAPMTVRRTLIGPVLEFAGTGTIGSDYLDVILRRTCEREALDALSTFLAGTGTSMRLPRVRKTSAAAILLGRTLAERGWERLEVPTEVCPFIDLSGCSWDDYLKTLGPSHRYNFKRRLRNLHRDFDVRLQYAQCDDERQEALRHVVDLHLKRWESRGGSDAFDNRTLLAFHDDLSRHALDKGWLRLAVLTLDGKPAAAFYSFRYRNTFHFYQSGFDPAFVSHSVGLIMMGLTIQDAIAEGAAEYDLLHGDETYKFLWARSVHLLVRLELYSPGTLGGMHRATAMAKRFAKRVLRSNLASAPVAQMD
jgi:CelD/BcsL family acetyltransferase involved in cellulose biosynthesis